MKYYCLQFKETSGYLYPKGKAPLGMQEYFIGLHLKESGVDRDDILRKGAVSVVG